MLLQTPSVGDIGGVLEYGVAGVLLLVLGGVCWYHWHMMKRKDKEIDDYRTALREEQLNFVAMLREQLKSYGIVISKMSSLPDDVANKIVLNIDIMQKALHDRVDKLPDQNAEKISPIIKDTAQGIKDTINAGK